MSKPKFRITQSNPKKAGDSNSWVRIYRDGVLIAQEAIQKRNPLTYLENRMRSKHLVSLERQLFLHGLTLTDVGLRYKGNAAIVQPRKETA